MADVTQPLETDDVLAARAQKALAKSREAQLVAALLSELGQRNRPWWTSQSLRDKWNTTTRLTWLKDRPDVRGRVTQALTGLAPRAARDATVEFQASLIDMVLETGDVSLSDWESAFSPGDLALHGPTSQLWHEFRARFPWDAPAKEDRSLLVWLLDELLRERREGGRTTSIMTPLYVRSAIDVRVWQEHIPLDIRVQVDGRRLRKELEGKGFTCRDELAAVKTERIVEHIAPKHLMGILDALERVLPGLGGKSNAAGGGDAAAGERTESLAAPQGAGTH